MTNPPGDRQSLAYRQATDADVWDGDLQAVGARVHEPIRDLTRIRLPDDYEQDHWDTDRTSPKSVEEAREALVARIADPHAPDSEAEASAYDEDGT